MISPIRNNTGLNSIYPTKEKIKEKETNSNDKNGVLLQLGSKDVKDTIYNKPVSFKPDIEEIERLKREAEKSTMSLRHLVEKLIARQGKSFADVIDGKQTLEIDPEARAEAEQLISENGELGVKQTADRIVDFAKALSGGDKSKISELRDAIKKGFDEASGILGGLPDISSKTYDEVMSRLDQWEKE